MAREQRKLAAILAADVVGYFRLIGGSAESRTLSTKRYGPGPHKIGEPGLRRWERLVKAAWNPSAQIGCDTVEYCD